MSKPVTPISILLVDDDQASLYALLETLQVRLKGAQVMACQSAIAALAYIETIDFDVIVSDIRMPAMDGLELLQRIRDWLPNTPILLISGYDDYQVAVQAMRDGAYDLIQKPLDLDYFMTSLQSAIQARQVNRMQQTLAMQQSAAMDQWTLLRGVKVLMIEDDQDGREMQSMILQAYGADVLAVDSAKAALAAFEQFNPDVLVSDIRMPEEDGYSLIRKVRQIQSYSNEQVPAVALSAYAADSDRTLALKVGFQLQLAKPVNPITLALTVASLVKGTDFES
ncbi:MAG TPA: response regulator [Coleofasciculaceae cyanobacterium]